MDSSSKPLLRVENLTKKYTTRKRLFKEDYFFALDNISFSVNPSEIVALIGESGSGKSTIGRIVTGLSRPSAGKIYFQDVDISSIFPRELRKEISIIFQDPRTSLNPRFRVRDIVAEPLVVNGYPKKEIGKRVDEALTLVQLDPELGDRYPHELSGGQRQRVAIARAVVLGPRLVVADEPTSALDVSIQLQIIRLIKELNRQKGIAFLFISHDIGVVSSISDRILVLYRGKIMETGRTEDVIKNPKHPYTRLLIDSLPPSSPRSRKVFPKVEEDMDGIDKTEGCEFYARCPLKSGICLQKPQLKNIDSREVYCHLA